MSNLSYFLYGLTVWSEVPLTGQPSAPAGAAPDFIVVRGSPLAATAASPPGRVLLDFEGGERWYTLVQDDAGYRFRVYGVCDFQISADLGSVTVQPFEHMTDGMEGVIIPGALCAVQLGLRGRLVLHASAVDLDGSALAFAGHSGMGKSTLATLMCAQGAAVITDDVLCVEEQSDGTPTARLGVAELRLRSGLEGLVDGFPEDVGVRTSADRRTVVRPTRPAADRLPIIAVVVPSPTRTGDAVEVTRLSSKEAMLLLLGLPRLMGWCDPDVLSRTFTQIGALVERVPVLIAQVPWGPPFPPDLASQLRRAVG
jgi:hypothetical protein